MSNQPTPARTALNEAKKMASTGRIVLFYGNGTDKHLASPLPAIVVFSEDENNTALRLSVQTGLMACPVVVRGAVLHKSEAEQVTGLPYWDWPVIR